MTDIDIIITPPAATNITITPPAPAAFTVTVAPIEVEVAVVGTIGATGATGPAGPTGPTGATGPAGSGGGGGAATGTLLDPIIHDDVKWYWGSNGDEPIIGVLANDPYDGSGVGVLTATNSNTSFPAPLNGAIPPAEELTTWPHSMPLGSAANVAAGVQVGDRVYWDEINFGHQGIYTVTDLGSVSTPWVLTRAADMPIADLLLAFYVEVEGTGVAIQTRTIETNPEFIAPAAFRGVALGAGSAADTSGTASGNYARAAVGGVAIGPLAIAGTNAVALGSSTRAPDGTVVVGSVTYGAIVYDKDLADAYTGLIDFAAGASGVAYIYGDIEFTTANVASHRHIRLVIFNDDAAPHSLVFPAAWRWVGTAAPASLDAGRVALLTLTTFGDEDQYTVATYLVEP